MKIHSPIKIQQPDLDKIDKEKIYSYVNKNSGKISPLLLKTEYPEYLHWTDIKRKSWIPDSLSAEQFWGLIKMFRKIGIPTAVKDTNGSLFTWNKSKHYDQLLHELDLNTGGRLIDKNIISEDDKGIYITKGLIEESIASAQLEGAHTTREFAKKMIEEGREPADTGQRMIMNNYKTMKNIENNYKDQSLSYEMLIDMHVMLTKNTLKKENQVGRFRTDGEDIVVGNDEHVAYVPPPIDFVNEQIKNFIAYANDDLKNDSSFVHPVIKAIILHFWMGFLHPFADGNGRVARAIFYWYLLRKGYWAFSFIPVSTKIKISSMQYSRAYLYSEQDDNDLSYFIDYNLRKITLARREFGQYIKTHSAQQKNIEKLTEKYSHLNFRQVKLIQFFKSRPKERTNVSAMQNIHGISHGTAISDLKKLVNIEYLTKARKGKYVFYYPTEKLLNEGLS